MFSRIFNNIIEETRDGAITGIKLYLYMNIFEYLIDSIMKMSKSNYQKTSNLENYHNKKRILSACLYAPLYEEFKYRQILMPVINWVASGINQKPEIIPGLILSSFKFGIDHGPGNLPKIYASMGGMVFGTLALKYEGRITASIIAHATNNIIEFSVGAIQQELKKTKYSMLSALSIFSKITNCSVQILKHPLNNHPRPKN